MKRNTLAACVYLAGSPGAGVLLYRLRWFQRVATISFDDGPCWIAKTQAQLKNETGMTRRQVRDALDLLRELNLVEMTVRSFRGRKVTHLRFSGRAEVMLRSGLSVALQGQRDGPMGPDDWPSGANAMYREQGREQDRELDTCAPLRGRAVSDDFREKVSGGGKSLTQTVEDIVNGKVSRKPVRKSGKATLSEIWRAEVIRAADGGFVPGVTGAAAGQLRMVEKQLSGEIDFTRFARTIVSRWAEFANEVRSKAGNVGVPSEPHVGFVLKHVGIAVNFCLASALSHGKKAGPATGKEAVATQEPKAPEEEAASAAEALAILKGD